MNKHSGQPQRPGLVVRADDFGMCHAVNAGIARAWAQGIVTAVEIMAPGPWFWEAARICRAAPGMDVGVHLTLFSEWRELRWRPLSPSAAAASFTDAAGCFLPHARALLRGRPDWARVEREFRLQVEAVAAQGLTATHCSLHWPRSAPWPRALCRVVETVSRGYRLPLSGACEENVIPPHFLAPGLADAALKGVIIRDMGVGINLAVVHPAADDPELRALTQRWKSAYSMEHRRSELAGLVRPGLKRMLRAAGVRLLDYRDVRKQRAGNVHA